MFLQIWQARPYLAPYTLSRFDGLGQACGTFGRNVAGNQLGGPLPDAWAAPGALQRLAQVNLDSNFFSAALPPTWALGLPSLSWFSANENRLSGAAPAAGAKTQCTSPPLITKGGLTSSWLASYCKACGDCTACDTATC